jgi:hypothetical protein
MQRFWSWLAVTPGRHALVVSLVGLVVTLALGVGITRLEFSTGTESYLRTDSQVYRDNVRYQELFGGNPLLTAITMDEGSTVDELFTPGNIEEMERVAEELRAQEDVRGVISPVTALEFSSDLVQPPEGGTVFDAVGTKALTDAQAAAEARGDTESAEARSADLAATSARLLAIPPEQQVLENPAYVQFLLYTNDLCSSTRPAEGDEVASCPNAEDPATPLVGTGDKQIRKGLLPFFPDPTHAAMATRLDGNLELADDSAAAEAAVDVAESMRLEGAATVTTGPSLLLEEINDYLQRGMLTLGAVGVGLTLLILLLFFHVRWRLLPLGVVLLGLVWAFGAAGYLGIPLTLVTIAGLPVMLGLGVDYAIQMHSRIEEEVILGESPHPIQSAARGLGPALVVVIFDAVFALVAIQRSEVPMIKEFGWLLIVGVVAIGISSIINPLAIVGMREWRRPTATRPGYAQGRMARMAVWLGSAPGALGLWFAVAAVAVFAVGSALEPKLDLEADPVRWINPAGETHQRIEDVEDAVGGGSELGVFLQARDGQDLLSDQAAVDFADRLAEDAMAEHGDALVYGTSIVSTVAALTDLPGAEHETPAAETVRAAWDLAPEDIRGSTAADDGQALNVVFLAAAEAPDGRELSIPDQAVVVDDLATTPQPDELTYTLSGLSVIGVGLFESLHSNLVQLTWLAVLLVFAFLWVRLRSLTRAALSMVPVLVSTGVVTIAVYVLPIKLSPMTAVGGPLVVAACTEFTSLILLRYLEERRRGLEPRVAMDVTSARTGRAFFVSAMTAVGGVAVLALSSLPLLRDFGIFMAVKVAIALLAALVILPPLVVWADRSGRVSRGMLEREEQPFLDVPRSRAEAGAQAAT